MTIYNFYGSEMFKATWKKFLEIANRDGRSGGELLRIWIEQYVKTKEPGNPQPPLTAYVEGHDDRLVIVRRVVFNNSLEYAKNHRSFLPFVKILDLLKQEKVGKEKALIMANDITSELHRLGVKIER